MKKVFQWVAINAAFSVMVYAGFIVGLEGAQYVVKFFVWVFFLPISLLGLTNQVQKKLADEPVTQARRTVGIVISWATLVILVWNGNVFTGFAWAIYMLCGAVARAMAEKHKVAQKQVMKANQ